MEGTASQENTPTRTALKELQTHDVTVNLQIYSIFFSLLSVYISLCSSEWFSHLLPTFIIIQFTPNMVIWFGPSSTVILHHNRSVCLCLSRSSTITTDAICPYPNLNICPDCIWMCKNWYRACVLGLPVQLCANSSFRLASLRASHALFAPHRHRLQVSNVPSEKGICLPVSAKQKYRALHTISCNATWQCHSDNTQKVVFFFTSSPKL